MNIRRTVRTRSALKNALKAFVALLFVSIVVGAVAHLIIVQREYQQLSTRMHELLGTMQSSTSIACYLSDHTLSSEIGNNLLKNSFIQRVTIVSGKKLLTQSQKSEIQSLAANWRSNLAPEYVSAEIMSPFNAREKMCDIFIEPNKAYIDLQIESKSQLIFYSLLITIILFVPCLIFQILNSSTQRIAGLSHKLRSSILLDQNKINYHVQDDEITRLEREIDILSEELRIALERTRVFEAESFYAHKLFEALHGSSCDAIFKITSGGVVFDTNPAFRILFGLDIHNPEIRLPLIHGNLSSQTHTLINIALDQNKASEEILLDLPDGHHQWYVLTLIKISEKDLLGIISSTKLGTTS